MDKDGERQGLSDVRLSKQRRSDQPFVKESEGEMKKAKRQGDLCAKTPGLGFTIERRAGQEVVVYDGGGAVSLASRAEVALWKALKKKIKSSTDWASVDWQRLAISLAGACADLMNQQHSGMPIETALDAASRELKHDRGSCDCDKPKPWPQLPDYCAVCGGYGLTESEA